MNSRLILTIILFLILMALPGPAASARTLVPEDILLMENPGHFTLAPDGGNIVFIVTRGTDLAPPQGNGTLMVINERSGINRAVSDPSESVTSYALSPDGYRVVYAAMPRTGGATTLTLVDLHDMSRVRLEHITDELAGDYRWLGTDRLVFTGSPETGASVANPAEVIVVDAPPAPVILKTYSLSDGTIAPLSANNDVITIWEPSPDGRFVMYKAAPDPESWQTGATFRYVLFDALTGNETELFSLVEGYQDTNQFAWSPDSSTVYIERMQNGGLRYPVEYASDLVVYTPATATLEEVPLDWWRGLLIDLFNADIEVNPYNGGAYVLLAGGTNPRLARVERQGGRWHTTVIGGGNIFAIEADRTGTYIVYNQNSAGTPPQFYSASVEGNMISNSRQLTRMNQDLLKKLSGYSEVITWIGGGGDPVSGVVRYPPGYSPGQAGKVQYPLVLVIHGGPNYADFDSWRDTWEFPYHLITDMGAVTLSVNYHGSTNFGFEFARSIEGGKYYDLPIEDLESGIDVLAKKGVINRSRVGVTGWSNGGILTLALITRDPTLKAAIAGAGTADEHSQVANTNGIVMDKMYYNASPYQDPGSFQAILPIYDADKVETPLLMMIGTADNAVVPGSAWVTYRAYKEGSRAPVRFLLFQGMPHHMKTRETQLRKVQEELDWLERYLLT